VQLLFLVQMPVLEEVGEVEEAQQREVERRMAVV